MTSIDLDLRPMPEFTGRTDYPIGAIGAGFIMRDIQLPAYKEAGYNVVAIGSRSEESARAAAEQNGIARVHGIWSKLIRDREVEVLDIALPPHVQLDVVREVVEHGEQIKGILVQKPLATNLDDAAEIVRLCREGGITLAVNQNMRYDQSIRALKTLLDRGALGRPIVAQIVMNVHPDWQPFVADYGRVDLLNMSVHHIDAFRYLLGDPTRIVVSVAPDPSTEFPHEDGSAFYILEYEEELRAVAIENCFASQDVGIDWRVDGTRGMAKGTIGWPDYPDGSPSTICFRTEDQPGYLFNPEWKERWFPQAFAGTMGELLQAVSDGADPPTSGEDNLRTMAVIEAAYRAVSEGRAVETSEFTADLPPVPEAAASR